jgi:glycosyltransferase involved in cell wall biosynthesis
VIAFRVGAHPEVIADGSSGLLVQSERGFLDAMRELVDDAARRTQMGERAVEWAARFRWAETVARYDEVVSAAMVGRPPAVPAAGP